MKNIGIALGLSIALGLGSAVAHADEVVGPPAPAAPAPATAPASEDKPLVLRETKPADGSAPTASGTSTTMTLLKGLGVAGIAIAGFMVFKRKKVQGARSSGVDVKIVGRTSLGMRTEVCVIDVGGERLVLGVTPTTVTTLSVLQDAPVALGEIADATDTADAVDAPSAPNHAEMMPATRRTRSVADEPESALLRLLENARKQTGTYTPTQRQSGGFSAPQRHASADDTPTTRHDLDAEATVALPPKQPAPARQRQARRIEEQVRGLNVAKPRRAS